MKAKEADIGLAWVAPRLRVGCARPMLTLWGQASPSPRGGRTPQRPATTVGRFLLVGSAAACPRWYLAVNPQQEQQLPMSEPQESEATPGRLPSGAIQGAVWLISVLVTALITALGLNGGGTKIENPPVASSGVASAEALSAVEAKLLAAMADSRAKASEQAAKQSEQLATLIARDADQARRLAKTESALEAIRTEIARRTADRYPRQEAAQDKASSITRDQRQDDRLRELEKQVGSLQKGK